MNENKTTNIEKQTNVKRIIYNIIWTILGIICFVPVILVGFDVFDFPDDLLYTFMIFIIPIILIALGYIIINKNNVKNFLLIFAIILLAIHSAYLIYLYNSLSFVDNTNRMDKPIIYLYPEEETEVSVELGYPDKITVSYPEYTTSWKVLAESNGTLTDLTTIRKLYSLYYESIDVVKFKMTNEGFVVKSEDTAEFLEEKLAILGLNEREAEEFIIYWLPILQENEYNYIRFATADEIERNMPLTINPNPDTLIRVLMTYKGLSEPIEVEEQELETPERTGFVAVEWGGTEIK